MRPAEVTVCGQSLSAPGRVSRSRAGAAGLAQPGRAAAGGQAGGRSMTEYQVAGDTVDCGGSIESNHHWSHLRSDAALRAQAPRTWGRRWPGPDRHQKELATPERCRAYARLAEEVARSLTVAAEMALFLASGLLGATLPHSSSGEVTGSHRISDHREFPRRLSTGRMSSSPSQVAACAAAVRAVATAGASRTKPSAAGSAAGAGPLASPRSWPYLSLIHISEPTRRTPISYAVFCLKKKKRRR